MGQTCSGAFSQPSLERQSGQRRDPGTAGDRHSEGQWESPGFGSDASSPLCSQYPLLQFPSYRSSCRKFRLWSSWGIKDRGFGEVSKDPGAEVRRHRASGRDGF